MRKFSTCVLAILAFWMATPASAVTTAPSCTYTSALAGCGGDVPGSLIWVVDTTVQGDCSGGGGEIQSLCVRKPDGTISSTSGTSAAGGLLTTLTELQTCFSAVDREISCDMAAVAIDLGAGADIVAVDSGNDPDATRRIYCHGTRFYSSSADVTNEAVFHVDLTDANHDHLLEIAGCKFDGSVNDTDERIFQITGGGTGRSGQIVVRNNHFGEEGKSDQTRTIHLEHGAQQHYVIESNRIEFGGNDTNDGEGIFWDNPGVASRFELRDNFFQGTSRNAFAVEAACAAGAPNLDGNNFFHSQGNHFTTTRGLSLGCWRHIVMKDDMFSEVGDAAQDHPWIQAYTLSGNPVYSIDIQDAHIQSWAFGVHTDGPFLEINDNTVQVAVHVRDGSGNWAERPVELVEVVSGSDTNMDLVGLEASLYFSDLSGAACLATPIGNTMLSDLAAEPLFQGRADVCGRVKLYKGAASGGPDQYDEGFISTGTAVPAACTVGQVFIDTDGDITNCPSAEGFPVTPIRSGLICYTGNNWECFFSCNASACN